MFPLACPHCQEELHVPNNLAGCLIRCSECDGVVRAPDAETEESEEDALKPTFDVNQPVVHLGRSAEVQNMLDTWTNKAKEDAERKPYHRKRVPVELILGLLLIGLGVLLCVLAFLADYGLMSLFIYGVILPIPPILLGVLCLMAWDRSAGGGS